MTYRRDQHQLADRLKALRQGTGSSGNQYAQRLGWVQSRLSKIETGKQLPTESDIRAWVAAAGATREVVDELLDLHQRARIEYATWRDSYRSAHGAAQKQTGYQQLESRSTHLAEFQPAMVPGLLQTAEYAREMLQLPCGPAAFGSDERDVERMVAARMERQHVLYRQDKRIEMVMLDGALRTRLCSTSTLAGQLDRLMAVSGLSSLEVGIVPFEAPLPVFPLTAVQLFDDLAIVETLTGEQRLDEPDEVAHYQRFFELLREAAVTGTDATAVLRRAVASLEE